MERDKENELTLSPADAAAVDALLGGEAASPDAARQARVQEWLKVLNAAPAPEPRGDLAQRTLAAIAADARSERMKVTSETAGALASAPVASAEIVSGGATRLAPINWRRRMAEIGSMAIAACLLLAVTFEGIGQARRSNARAACFANLGIVKTGLDQYATAFNRQLPALERPANRNWLYGGGSNAATAAHNNAANLLPLLTGTYVKDVKEFFCKGTGVPDGPVAVSANALPEISYSYRNLYGDEVPAWDGSAETIVLTDKNPLFAVGGKFMRPEERNSPNHQGHGQYVLRADGSVTWEVTPNCGPASDNIWTLAQGPTATGASSGTSAGPQRLLIYTGTETPRSLRDAFVCP